MWPRIVSWAGADRCAVVLAASVLAVSVAVIAIALAMTRSSRSPAHGRSSKPHRFSGAASRTPPASAVAASPVAPGCGKDPRDVSSAGRVARRLQVQFMAYSLGRLGARPRFADATAGFRRAMWGMSHSPSPWQAGASVSVSLRRADVTAPGMVVARFSVRIDRPGLTAFSGSPGIDVDTVRPQIERLSRAFGG